MNNDRPLFDDLRPGDVIECRLGGMALRRVRVTDVYEAGQPGWDKASPGFDAVEVDPATGADRKRLQGDRVVKATVWGYVDQITQIVEAVR